MAFLQMKWVLAKQYRVLPSWPIWLRWVDAVFVFPTLHSGVRISHYQALCHALQHTRTVGLTPCLQGHYKVTQCGETFRFSTLEQFLRVCGLNNAPHPLSTIIRIMAKEWQLDQKTQVHILTLFTENVNLSILLIFFALTSL